jgi:hypothetical protein
MIHRLCTDYSMRGRYTDKVPAALADVEARVLRRKTLLAQTAAEDSRLYTQKAWRVEWTEHNQTNSISEVPI